MQQNMMRKFICFKLQWFNAYIINEPSHERTCFKGADQLRGYYAAGQCLGFHYIDNKTSLLPESEILSV